jgi:hypothetical protein
VLVISGMTSRELAGSSVRTRAKARNTGFVSLSRINPTLARTAGLVLTYGVGEHRSSFSEGDLDVFNDDYENGRIILK